MPTKEHHHTQRVGWLRAAVLGANDGIVSTASLVVGVAASGASSQSVLVAGVAGWMAGAMSMAAGEYVSVSSQADAEAADLDLERRALAYNTEDERSELAEIYVERGLEPGLAAQVAEQLMAKDALAAHARDELGFSETMKARPVQAAVVSGLTFSAGALTPLLGIVLFTRPWIIWSVSLLSLFALALLGGTSARLGGASLVKGVLRVVFWGAMAMAATAGIGVLFGVVF